MSELIETRRSPSPEQQKVIDTWGKGISVIAGAGSGKTTTLVMKCQRLLEMNPQARILAVSFTERSASDLREKISLSLRGDHESGRHWVMTIHGLCAALIREHGYGKKLGAFHGGWKLLSEVESQNLWEESLDWLWSSGLAGEVEESLERLLSRETRTQVQSLLERVKSLSAFGAVEELASSSRGPGDFSGALIKVFEAVFQRYTRLKRRAEAMDFEDLERGASLLLQEEPIAQAVQRRFDLILVDEFQDTNPLQAELVWKIARPDASNLCVVGDPKQSIYRFRDADVGVFEEYSARLPVRVSLDWNFRSVPAIIDFTNQLCAPLFEASELRYDPLIPKRLSLAQEEVFGSRAVSSLEVSEPGDLARWLIQQRDQGASFDEFAVVTRKIRGNERWFRALMSQGIPLAIGSGGLFWEDPRVRELVAFLKWWEQPAHRLSGAVFLRAPWVGIDDRLLDQWVREDPTWQKPFFESSHPLAKTLRGLRESPQSPGNLLLRLLGAPLVERDLGASLLGLWHRCESLSLRGLSSHAVVRELERSIQNGRRERDVPPPRGQGQLLVLTVHGAKGLEFKRVILIDFPERTRMQAAPLLFWDRKEGAYLAGRTAEGERETKNPAELHWRSLEERKNLAESKRVFYVALTRARDQLILVREKNRLEEKKKEDTRNPLSRDDWRKWLDHAGPEDSTFKKILPTEKPLNPPLAHEPVSSAHFSKPRESMVTWRRPRHSVTEWNLLGQCPRAYEWGILRPPTSAGAKKNDLSFGNKGGSEGVRSSEEAQDLGTRVHRLLEKGDELGLRNLELEVGSQVFSAETWDRWRKSNDWMNPASPEKMRRVWTELPFELQIGRESLVGAMDRVIEDRGQWRVLDFKVSRKNQSAPVILERYRTQLELYAEALVQLGASRERLSAWIIWIAPHEVQQVEVPLPASHRQKIFALAEQAGKIANGESGEPRIGQHCSYCEWAADCDAGSQYLKKLAAAPANLLH